MRWPMSSGDDASPRVAPLFVTATGTDIGKTFVCAALIRHLRAASRPVRALKPVISGFDAADPSASDTAVLLDALGLPVCAARIAEVSPWRYAAPLAPNMAARAEHRTVDFDDVVAFCRRHIADAVSETVLIEGVGGVMVPLDDTHTVLDWIAALRVPALLVTGSYLGAISHALTCAEVMRARGVLPAAILVNETPGGGELAQTVETIAAFVPGADVFAVSRDATAAGRDGVLARVLAGRSR